MSITLKKIIIRYLLLHIQHGNFKFDDKVMSEGQLLMKFKCNRHTISSAIQNLEKNKHIKFISGKGYYWNDIFSNKLVLKKLIKYNSVSSKKINFKNVPIQILDSNYKETIFWKSTYKFNGIKMFHSYLFVKNKLELNAFTVSNPKILFKKLAQEGIVILSTARKVYITHNEDHDVVNISIIFYNEDGETIIKSLFIIPIKKIRINTSI